MKKLLPIALLFAGCSTQAPCPPCAMLQVPQTDRPVLIVGPGEKVPLIMQMDVDLLIDALRSQPWFNEYVQGKILGQPAQAEPEKK